MLRRALVLLGVTVALAACQPPLNAPTARRGLAGGPPASTALPAGTRIALLAPLTGPRADIGAALQRGAELALSTSPAGTDAAAPTLDVRDTGGTPGGAATAARAAIAAGAGMILGPLTAAETAAVAPIAGSAHVPVLAFTNDPAEARPGVWPLGITPRQQVDRLLAALRDSGKTRTAALLPENDFGRVMGNALRDGTAALGMPAPTVREYGQGMSSIQAAVRDISDYANRRGPLDAKAKADRARHDAEGRRAAAAEEAQGVPPPPFDALLLADTGTPLNELASLLPYYDLRPAEVRIVGPAIWAAGASGARDLPGAWFAGPDPAARSGFVTLYQGRYSTPPPPLADLAYDAASIAKAARAGGGFSDAVLTAPSYNGVDGLLALGTDGHVLRALAVFEVGRGGNTLVAPAPQSLAAVPVAIPSVPAVTAAVTAGAAHGAPLLLAGAPGS